MPSFHCRKRSGDRHGKQDAPPLNRALGVHNVSVVSLPLKSVLKVAPNGRINTSGDVMNFKPISNLLYMPGLAAFIAGLAS